MPVENYLTINKIITFYVMRNDELYTCIHIATFSSQRWPLN